MSLRENILQAALSLPPEDRTYIANALQDSLVCVEYVSDEFMAELQRRSAAYRAGLMAARPMSKVLTDLRMRDADDQTR